MDPRPAPKPKGLQNSAQGFNPGKPQNKRFALKLKGREMRVPDKVAPLPRKSQSAQLGRATIGPSDPLPLVRTFDLAPLSGRVALGGRFPGLKPWAEFYGPCGAQNKGHGIEGGHKAEAGSDLSPRIVAYSIFGANHPKPYLRAIRSHLSGTEVGSDDFPSVGKFLQVHGGIPHYFLLGAGEVNRPST
jgi:hypothetical protein